MTKPLFHHSVALMVLLVSVASVALLPGRALGDSSAPTTLPLLQRIASDSALGKPLVATVYVALCDNDSQGIVPVRNRAICNGDDAENNLYWKGNGIAGYLKSHGWKRVAHRPQPQDDVLIEDVWKKRLVTGTPLRQLGANRVIDAFVVAKAYRGSQIRQAMGDYITAVHSDAAEPVSLLDGTVVEAGGASHVVGYIGHDYFMDIQPGQQIYGELMAPMGTGTSVLQKGAFALACISNEFVRPAVTRSTVYILAMNNFLTYPSAWTVGGILEGIARGLDGKGVYREAARSFAAGQKCGMKWALKAFSYGPQ